MNTLNSIKLLECFATLLNWALTDYLVASHSYDLAGLNVNAYYLQSRTAAAGNCRLLSAEGLQNNHAAFSKRCTLASCLRLPCCRTYSAASVPQTFLAPIVFCSGSLLNCPFTLLQKS
ncbi:hypothetical protein KIL84_000145 [Mauremys mutica]|uniref:Secreted protein n=1 Tax=Mauremys mutica TaxID=74926 RepID=A0A9D4B344_9SAUR|nr:hypothetical protein KIL84_000145 [Mauremys mutica]